MHRFDRRSFLLSVPAMAMAPRLLAQAAKTRIRVRALNHLALSVSDPEDSIDFYQGLFGMPIQARHGPTTLLRIGFGPEFLAIGPAGSGPPSISHFCMGVENFDADDLITTLEDHGLTRSEGPDGGLSGGPMKVRVRMRGPEAGGSPEGTPHVYFGDPDGIVVQLQHPSYCGGASVLGNLCNAPEPADRRGLLAVRGLSHLTISVSDAQRSNAFYQELFGLEIQAYQGPTAPLLGVGSGVQFLMFGSGGAARGGASVGPRQASINHACMNMEGFNPDRVLKTLESYGIKPRENAQGAAGPMRHYITLRTENRGGAKNGTPELYFTDPDGILIQLQDVSYCGGSGFLGNVCP
jgi:catechol 2,3-dioxygenase-like lactoylglutathione lyase family enzyme